LLAFGCVVFTTCAVAAVAHWLLGLPLAVGFVLGAIVAPPDVVAPLALVRPLGVPRRLLVVLEGEGLANDATALVLYRFAVAAIGTGLFSFGQAAGTFALIVVGEIAYGAAVGWFSLRLRRWAHDPRVEITLSLITPYIAFLLPQQLGGSGVLATVATGLYVSWNGPLLIPAATRLQGIFFWDLVVYFLEGFVFLVTGIETRVLLDRAAAVEIRELAFAIVLTVAVVVVARFVWVFPATYLPRWLSASLRRRDPQPPWQLVFILAFTGVRGVVSLAAALAIPLTTAIGTPFPDRNLILLVTFGVIIVTLIGNGLLLPSVIRVLGLSKEAVSEREREQKAERAARSAALKVARERLEGIASDRQIAPDILSSLRTRHDYRVTRLPGESAEGRDLTATEADVMAELIAVEREHIYRLLQDGQITDEARRRIERDLDLEEASIATFRKSEPDPPL
jgi:CPA1 family monovalent cation:H+ antiporter